MELRPFKFVIKRPTPDPDVAGLSWNNMLCVVIARSLDEAIALAENKSRESGVSPTWVRAAQVQAFPLDAPAVLGFAAS